GPLQEAVGAGGLLHWAWVIPGGLFVAAVGMIYLRFVIALPRATRTLFLVSAGLYVGGALVVEMLGALWFSEFGRRNLGYVLFWTIEETGEMLGVTAFIYALMTYLRDEVGVVALRFGGRSPSARADTRQISPELPG